MSLLVLIGTKAQFIKMAPVLREMDKRLVPYRLVYTGQHSETFDLLEAAFGTRPPDDVLVPDFEAATHRSFLSWIFRYWQAVLVRMRSDAWKGVSLGLVHGDTASTLFGAIAIRFAGGMVGHIEAGLRSPRLLEPFPEEIIRRLVSRMSHLHFVPDDNAERNLAGVGGRVIHTQGNTLKDALAMSLQRLSESERSGGNGGYAVVSMHRSENLSSKAVFDMLMGAVIDAAEVVPIKFVLHPATREKIGASEWLARLQRVPALELLERMDYPDFVRLLVGARFLMTDGGSNQEEAAMMGLPTLLLRRTTERMDGVGGVVEVSGLDPVRIREFVNRHAQGGWSLRLIDGGSPTGVLVDVLQAYA
ncbi:UDP-N-acetylglucosamine 2-epimerase (non-hydrolyzing) [Pseudoxanthomonas sangjuensis]|uniref:UDP-N-acetylglucosamine 2-epimerase n=1 Tax=Pseudoxanthomonas sangjuensis TaxID=1503750 RepID=UPI001391DDD5|nr:UDP-N-acetylglucosamine 2-epimerase [Pseudoxanthomonas sangjuensis]KAF1713235.1 hypothetical protein CSC71_08795 [Pseudoxanthomonas sangjuensis]